MSHFRLRQWLPAHLARDARTLTIPMAVWMVWLAATLVAAWFVARYGLNLPYWDDWNNILALEGRPPITLQWLWDFHVDHRIPIPKLAFLTLYALSGHDVRAVMFASVAILSLTAMLSVLAARRLSGRTRLTDAVLPLLLLGLAQYENLLWAFQIVFVLTTGLFCLTVYQVLRLSASFRPSGVAVLGVSVLCLILSDVSGLVLAVPVIAWLAMTAWVHRRSCKPGARLACALALLTTAAAIPIVVGYDISHRSDSPVVVPPSGPVQILLASVQFAAVSLASPPLTAMSPVSGGLVRLQGVAPTSVSASLVGLLSSYFAPGWLLGSWGFIGGLVIAAIMVAAWNPARRVFRLRPDVSALAPLACLASVALVAIAIGYGRGYGSAPRYATLSASLICTAYFCLSQQKGRTAALASSVLLVTSLFLYPWNANNAVAFGQSRRAFEAGLLADIRAGTPVVLLGTRYYQGIWGDPTMAVDMLKNMQDQRIGPFRAGDLPLNEAYPQVVSEEPLSTAPVAIHNMTKIGDYWHGDGGNSYLLFSIGSSQLAGVRMKYSMSNVGLTPALLELAWSDSPRTEFSTEGNKFVSWGVPADFKQQELLAWIGDRVGMLRITPDIRSSSFRLDEIVLLHSGVPSDFMAETAARNSAADRAQLSGTFIRASGDTIYVIEDGWRHSFPNWATYLRYGGREDLSNVVLISDLELSLIPDGEPIPPK